MFYQNTRSPATRSGKLQLVLVAALASLLALGLARLHRARRQPVVPAPAGHASTSTAASRTASPRATSSPSRTDVKTIDGAPCVVVSDRLYLDGQARGAHDRLVLAGRAAATSGTSARRRPSSTRTAASRAPRARGRPAATARRPGIYMPAHPRAGPLGAAGVLQGPGRGSLRGPQPPRAACACRTRSSRRALLTKEWTPLEPGVVDHKLLRPRDRHRARADRARRRRAPRARLRHALTDGRRAPRGRRSAARRRARSRARRSGCPPRARAARTCARSARCARRGTRARRARRRSPRRTAPPPSSCTIRPAQ